MDSNDNSTNVKNEDKKKNIEINQVQKKEDSSNIPEINCSTANDIAIYIVKTSKIFFEKYFSETVEEENEKLFTALKPKNFVYGKELRDFNLDLFDEPLQYYNDLKNYFNFKFEHYCNPTESKTDKIRSLIKSNISVYYFSILLDLLLEILEKNPNAHNDNIIKFNITMICELFREKNERLFSSNSYFYCCVNELMEKYKIDKLPEKNTFRKNYFEICKNKASTTLAEVKTNLVKYIKENLDSYCQILSEEWKNKKCTIQGDEDQKACEKIQEKYKKIRKLISSNENNYFTSEEELKKWCEKNAIDIYLDEYAGYLTEKKCFSKITDKIEWKKHLKENCLLPYGILKIDGENEENIYILSAIKYDKNVNYSEDSYDGKTFYEQYIIIKEELNYLNQRCYKEEMEALINDDSFLKELFSVLQSRSVSFYLKSIIKFDSDKDYDYKVDLVEVPLKDDKIDEDFLFEKKLENDLYLGERYNAFLSDMMDNFSAFRKLIIFKELGYKLPACTGPSMRIFINPRLQFSKVAIENNLQRKDILKSALIILLVHEITHLLKYYPSNKKYPDKTPKTPKNRENGKCLMFYLFNKPVIDKINFRQSSEINNVNNWENIAILKKIFENTNNQNPNDKSKEKEGELDLYSSNSEKMDLKKSKKRKINTDYCWWW